MYVNLGFIKSYFAEIKYKNSMFINCETFYFKLATDIDRSAHKICKVNRRRAQQSDYNVTLITVLLAAVPKLFRAAQRSIAAKNLESLRQYCDCKHFSCLNVPRRSDKFANDDLHRGNNSATPFSRTFIFIECLFCRNLRGPSLLVNYHVEKRLSLLSRQKIALATIGALQSHYDTASRLVTTLHCNGNFAKRHSGNNKRITRTFYLPVFIFARRPFKWQYFIPLLSCTISLARPPCPLASYFIRLIFFCCANFP